MAFTEAASLPLSRNSAAVGATTGGKEKLLKLLQLLSFLRSLFDSPRFNFLRPTAPVLVGTSSLGTEVEEAEAPAATPGESIGGSAKLSLFPLDWRVRSFLKPTVFSFFKLLRDFSLIIPIELTFFRALTVPPSPKDLLFVLTITSLAPSKAGANIILDML